MLNFHVRQKCHEIKLRKPSSFIIKKHLQENFGISNPPKEVVDNLRSWRDCFNWYYGGQTRSTAMMTELEQAQEIFSSGPQHRHYSITPERLLEYYIHNGGNQQVASLLHTKMSQNARMRKVAKDALTCLRLESISRIGYYKEKKEFENRRKVKLIGFY